MGKIVSIISIAVLLIITFVIFKGEGATPTNVVENGDHMTEDEVMEDEVMMEEVEVKDFYVEGSPFKFVPNTITVNKGDTVRITFKNVQGTHDWRLDEFSAATNVIQTGETEVITFVASESGVFEFYCSVGNHRAMGMVGTLTVLE